MGMMGNPGAFGGPYTGQGNQGLGGAGLGPQLQNKGPMAQFNVDKKPLQGMGAMVRNKYKPPEKMFLSHARMSCTIIILPSWQI